MYYNSLKAENMVKKGNDARNTDMLDDSFDAYGDYNDSGLNAPKRSPMRRKEKFRAKDSETDTDHKDRKRKNRHKLKYDFEFWRS